MRRVRTELLIVAQVMAVQFHVRKVLAAGLAPVQSVLMNSRVPMGLQIFLGFKVRGAVLADVSIPKNFHVSLGSKTGVI